MRVCLCGPQISLALRCAGDLRYVVRLNHLWTRRNGSHLNVVARSRARQRHVNIPRLLQIICNHVTFHHSALPLNVSDGPTFPSFVIIAQREIYENLRSKV